MTKKGTERQQKEERLSFYYVDMKYIRNLHKKDDKVPSVSPQIGKESRVFLGIVVLCYGKKYCIPLSHPKQKHESMRGRIDFTKILDESGNMIAALNFNLMIPVEMDQLTKVDIQIHQNDSQKIKQYKKLCQKELTWCRKHAEEIKNKANVLYQMYIGNEAFSARTRCLNFPKLEEECKKYTLRNA